MAWLFFGIPIAIGIIWGTIDFYKKQPGSTCYISNLDLEEWGGNEIPYYIDEQIQAIYKQLESYHNLIDSYREQASFTSDINKRLVLNKRISDLEYKCSKLEEKVYKLLEKWEE